MRTYELIILDIVRVLYTKSFELLNTNLKNTVYDENEELHMYPEGISRQICLFLNKDLSVHRSDIIGIEELVSKFYFEDNERKQALRELFTKAAILVVDNIEKAINQKKKTTFSFEGYKKNKDKTKISILDLGLVANYLEYISDLLERAKRIGGGKRHKRKSNRKKRSKRSKLSKKRKRSKRKNN